MSQRDQLLVDIAEQILARPTSFILRVGIDGVDGAGKTTFADALAQSLGGSGRPIIRASVDGFHHPRALRYRLGRSSPEGFFYDSYNYAGLASVLLDPLSPGGTGRYRRALFDHTTDQWLVVPEEQAPPDAILIFDGIFLHRPELRRYWDFSIFLEVPFGVSIPRGAQRGMGSADVAAPENRRYIEGQQLYLRTCQPQWYATLVINNEDLTAPYLVKG